jgi:Sulfotransferase family
MVVSHEARLVFVHVQKTGGLTVEKCLLDALPGAVRPAGQRHFPLDRIHREQPDLISYWTFGFVRNPWARMWSWWSMIQRRRKVERNPFWMGVLAYPDFETFVLRGPEEFKRMRRPQIDYLRSKHRSADFIGRTETLDADLARVCEHVGIEAPSTVERLNVGPAVDYRDQYTPRMRDRVAQLFAPDVLRFGYEF